MDIKETLLDLLDRLKYELLWIRGKVVKVKLINGKTWTVFPEKRLYERFCVLAHDDHGPGEEAIEKATDDAFRLAIAFHEGPKDFEKALDSMKKGRLFREAQKIEDENDFVEL